MSVSGITIDHSGKVEPKRADPFARLEAWIREDSSRIASVDLAKNDELCVELSQVSGPVRDVIGVGAPLSAAITAALDAWEAKP